MSSIRGQRTVAHHSTDQCVLPLSRNPTPAGDDTLRESREDRTSLPESKARSVCRRLLLARVPNSCSSDLVRYPNSSLGEIQARIGTEIPKRTLQRAHSGLIASGDIRSQGRLRGTKYICAT